MPRSPLGQMISFAVQLDAHQKFASYIFITAMKDDTIQKIASRRGHPEAAKTIAGLNKIRSIHQKLKKGKRIRLPGNLALGDVLHILADDPRPNVKDGFAMYDVVERPARKGLSRFKGYNPSVLDVPVQWEAFAGGDGKQVEEDIEKLERFAGRGKFTGAGVGPPAVLRVSATDNDGKVVPLIPSNYQWGATNPDAPLFRISNLTFDNATALGDDNARRIRQKVVIEITEYTPITVAVRSATARAKKRKA